MLYNEFGNTGKIVSKLGFGTNRFEPHHLQNAKGLQHCADVVRHAIECGINYFDTGHNYDNSKSEQILGLAFKDATKPVYVSAKSSSNFDKTADDVLRRVESSLKAMQLSVISFYHMWGVMNREHYRFVMSKDGPYQGLVRAKEAGLIEHICISTHANAEEIIEIINDGCFESLMISFNVMSAVNMRPVILAAYKKNIAVVSMNTIGGGINPVMHEFFEELLMPDDKDTAMAALRFNASHKELAVALSGMGTIEIVDRNVKAFSDTISINEDRVERTILSSNPVFSTFCTGCGYCAPCPAGIPVKKFLFAYNYNYRPIKGQHEKITVESRNFPLVFEKLGMEILRTNQNSVVNPCTKCGSCEERCTQRLPIINRIREIYDNLEISISIMLDSLKQSANRPIYIWGTGDGGIRALRLLRDLGYDINGFIDSDPKKLGMTVESVEIFLPDVLEDDCEAKPFVVIGVIRAVFRKEIETKLKALGFESKLDYYTY